VIQGAVSFTKAFVLVLAALAADAADVPLTPLSLPGATTRLYRDAVPEPVRLHIFQPLGEPSSAPRACLLVFFGGGWWRGLPSTYWPAWAARHGLVGVAADYRTRERFGATPIESVADARLALRWVQSHAEEIGVDPARVVVLGTSAGGHLALWTALNAPPIRLLAEESPLRSPAALVLLSPVTDTSPETGFHPERFGAEAILFSPLHQALDALPPMLIIHGDADEVVPFAQSERFVARLRAAGGACELVTVPGAGHDTRYKHDDAARGEACIEAFLRAQNLIKNKSISSSCTSLTGVRAAPFDQPQ